MNGAPIRGETIPIRLFLGGFETTPTFRDVNKKFSTRYYLNLVLIDEENRRYFKQQEITIFGIPWVYCRGFDKSLRSAQCLFGRQWKLEPFWDGSSLRISSAELVESWTHVVLSNSFCVAFLHASSSAYENYWHMEPLGFNVHMHLRSVLMIRFCSIYAHTAAQWSSHPSRTWIG